MTSKTQNWLVIGKPKNWGTALSQPMPIWGLKPRFQIEFQAMNVGDLLWFYSTSPVVGVIGAGFVKDKYVDNINLIWEDERIKKEVIYPLRFRIHVLKVLPQTRWKTERIKINDFNLFLQTELHPLAPKHTLELFRRAKEQLGVVTEENLFTGATIMQPLVLKEEQAAYAPVLEIKAVNPHRELQDQVAEIGKLQFYYTEIEHSIQLPGEKKNLDVVWKREIDGVPTFAFEVELSGMVEKAVERLKFAFRKWNSRPRIIVPQDGIQRLHNIMATSDKNFAEQVRIYEPDQIVKLLNLKRQLKSVEQNLAIY